MIYKSLRWNAPSYLLVALLLAACPCFAQQNAGSGNSRFKAIEDDPSLPRVLIIGDSISIGYTLPLREALKGTANLHRPPTNCGPTTNGLEHIEDWLGEGKWDLIHFNWGLHDLKYINEKGKKVLPPVGKQQVPPDDYAKNLETLVKRLKKTGAILVWRATTPVPEGAAGRIKGDELEYNNIALKIMKKHKIKVEDLTDFIKKQKIEHTEPNNVHFPKEGYEALAKKIAGTIKAALKTSQGIEN